MKKIGHPHSPAKFWQQLFCAHKNHIHSQEGRTPHPVDRHKPAFLQLVSCSHRHGLVAKDKEHLKKGSAQTLDPQEGPPLRKPLASASRKQKLSPVRAELADSFLRQRHTCATVKARFLASIFSLAEVQKKAGNKSVPGRNMPVAS